MKLITAVAAAALMTAISTSAAQAQTTLYGCYVKNTGTVYRIKTANTPTKCSGNATEFSWNMEGQVGPQGPQGPQGPAGPSAWPGVVMHMTTTYVVAGGEAVDIAAFCGAGQVLLSGGYWMNNPLAGIEVIGNWPHYDSEAAEAAYGWKVRARHNGQAGTAIAVRVYAYCMKAPV